MTTCPRCGAAVRTLKPYNEGYTGDGEWVAEWACSLCLLVMAAEDLKLYDH